MTHETKGAAWRRELEGADLQRYERVKAEFVEGADLFRRARKALNMSQVETAKLLGTTQANVSKIENRSEPDLDALWRLSRAIGGSFSVSIKTPDGEILEYSV
ncbi:helix-turn-helix domain-containing protein [Sphingomonas sp. IC-56]|uniref:helix-turn-helix domain-containing protein n=1 Tax=Sphingomonas sp. IC-56 TaxID=2898529 RepID=UPI001E44CE84|nr:helix-turn-helix transcriptional regulator [Sphingomonas sp. IC-56]MCD2322988.1 helix-turn-helix domain-containing protein [Sphingomonas sp. IC-56]